MVIALLPGKVNGVCTALEPGHPGGRVSAEEGVLEPQRDRVRRS